MENKNFQPIVMPCTAKQYNSLIPIFKEHNININEWNHGFKSIVNNYNKIDYLVSKSVCSINDIHFHGEFNRKIYKKFNRKVFLKSLGIVEKPEFILPKKWCIRITKENAYILNEYLIRHLHKYKHSRKSWHINTNIEVDNCQYFHSETYETNYGNHGHSSHIKHSNFTEITFEQFQKYVLKQDISILESQQITNKQTKMNSRIQAKRAPKPTYKKGDLVHFGKDIVAIVTNPEKLNMVLTVLFSRAKSHEPGDIIHTTNGSDNLDVFYGEVILEQ